MINCRLFLISACIALPYLWAESISEPEFRVHELKETEAFETLIKQTTHPLMVKFWAPWCGPCKRSAPIFHEIAKEYKHKLASLEVNIDSHPSIAQRYQVRSIPTIIFFKDAKPVDTLKGSLDYSTLRERIKNNFGF